jgi:hypothetical protein
MMSCLGIISQKAPKCTSRDDCYEDGCTGGLISLIIPEIWIPASKNIPTMENMRMGRGGTHKDPWNTSFELLSTSL